MQGRVSKFEYVVSTHCFDVNTLIKCLCNILFFHFSVKQEGNADPALKPDFYIFLLIFQHKWMFLSTIHVQTLQFEGHTVAYRCKGLTKATVCVSMK